MKKFLWIFGFLFLCFSCSQEEKETSISDQEPVLAPGFFDLSQLPDSLQPVTRLLADFLPARMISVPSQSGGSMSIKSESGEDQSIARLAPEKKKLLALTGPNGNPIQDPNGKPYFLGEGGISQFRTYSTDDGLALDGVNCAILDSRGHLWFGTNGGGISRYDGSSFTNYSTTEGLVGNTIRSIYEDKNGNIWIGTITGLSKFDGRQFFNFTSENGLVDDYVFGIIEDNQGDLWFGTGGGVNRYDGTTFQSYTTEDGLAGNFIITVGKDFEGNLYFGTNGEGMSKFDGTKFTTFSEKDGLAGNRVRSIAAAADGSLWIGTIGAGVSRLKNGKFENFSLSDGLADNIIRSIKEDRKGQIWFGTERGVSRYDGEKFTTYTRDQGMPASSVLDIVMDRSGKLWFCTDGGGITRFDGSAFTSFTVNQGLGGNLILSALEDSQGNLWFGSAGGGVTRFDGSEFTNFSLSQGLPGDVVHAIFQDREGSIWIGTGGGGLSKFDDNTFINFSTDQGLPSNEVYSITEDASGILWIGTENGVSRFDGVGFTNYSMDHGLVGNVVLSLLPDSSGGLWIGAVDGGVSYFKDNTFLNFTPDHGLVDYGVIRLVFDEDKNLWIGTEHGLNLLPNKDLVALLNREELNRNPFLKFTKDDGLPDEVILQIVPMKNKKMAIGTNLGLVFFDGPNENIRDFKITNPELFNSNTGYPVKDLTDGQDGMFQDSKGILWAGTGSNKTALVRFDYDALVRNQTAPGLFLKQIRINEEPISWQSLLENPDPALVDFEETGTLGKKLSPTERAAIQERFQNVTLDSITPFFPIPVGLVLPYRHNHLNIDFGTNELAKPFLVEYQYILEGYDEEWSPILKKTSATFGNIQEGEYTFKVRARFTGPSEGNASEWTEPIEFSFIVLPPWYRTWWAYLIYSLLFLSLIYPIHLYQKNLTIKAEQEKAKERELQQAREIEKAYSKLEAAHENLKSTQAQLIQQEKLASLGQLTAGIAHEIKNPLNFVNNFSGLSMEFLDEIEEELEKMEPSEALENVQDLLGDIRINLEKIRHHGGRADGIVKSMLMHSRGGSGDFEPTDLNELVKEYVNLSFHGMRANKNPINVEIDLKLADSLPKLKLNSEDFSRVILNLTKNAFDAMRDKLNKMGQEYKPVLSLTTQDLGDQVLLEVMDNGPGVPDEIKDKLLMPFFTTKKGTEGTGLGLSITHDIIKAHMGTLTITTEVGSWTKFSIILPKN